MRASSRRATHSGAGRRRAVAALHREALVLQRRQADRDPVRRASVVARRQRVDGRDAGELEVAAHARATTASSSPASVPRRVGERFGGRPQLAARRAERPGRGRARPARPQRAPFVARAAAARVERQQVVEVVGGLGLGRDLGVHPLDRLGVERADRRRGRRDSPRRSVHRVGAPVLELLVVEERVRPRGEDLVREHRRLGGVAAVHAHRRRPRSARAARATPSMSSASCSVSSIVWRTSTWSGISIGPMTFSWHAAACGNTAAMRSSDSMRWIGGGLRRPLRKRSTMQRPVEVPAPARLEHRRVEDGVLAACPRPSRLLR